MEHLVSSRKDCAGQSIPRDTQLVKNKNSLRWLRVELQGSAAYARLPYCFST